VKRASLADFFIERPIFAWVLAIAVMLGGLLGITTLPIANMASATMTGPRSSFGQLNEGAGGEALMSVTRVKSYAGSLPLVVNGSARDRNLGRA